MRVGHTVRPHCSKKKKKSKDTHVCIIKGGNTDEIYPVDKPKYRCCVKDTSKL